MSTSEAWVSVDKQKSRDFSRPTTFDLRTQKPNKTVDIGRNGVSLSLDACGRILQASTFHPEHGIVVAVPFEQFDRTKFYDTKYVRGYRKRMLQWIEQSKPGLGFIFGTNINTVLINILKVNVATFEFQIDEGINVLLFVEVLESGDILQTANVMNTKSTPATFSYGINLSASINRASYGQLTEGGPIPIPQSHNVLLPGKSGQANIVNPALGAQLAYASEDDGAQNIRKWPSATQEAHSAPIHITVPGTIELHPDTSVTLKNRFRLIPGIGTYQFDSLGCNSCFEHINGDGKRLNGENTSQPSPWLREDLLTTYILRRNVDYILANCTIPVSPGIVCIITDHVALPLGWNRDNYWQLHLLYETHKHFSILLHPSSTSDYTSRIHAVVKGHLNWVFRTAQRPHSYWHRSYLITGKPKDVVIFQLDQQCYPLLELCDYLDYFPSDEAFVREILELDVVPQILELLQSKRDDATGLWSTDETPGDDAVLYPYHFSSHVLLWRTLTRLRDLYTHFYTSSHPTAQYLATLSDALQTTTLAAFTVTHPESGEEIFAYLTDGKGKYTLYHDANDLPTLFALPWSFLSPASLSTYHCTLRFALSPLNAQAYCSGTYPGLGSVHSPGAWVLGYYQELAYALLRRDVAGMREAWRKVAAAMQWDGTFSEAVDANTGACSSKAWFSWPGSMMGALIVQLRIEGLEDSLLEV